MELSAVCDLGRKLKNEIIDKGGDRLEIFVENPNDNGKYNTVLEITFDKEFKYSGINVAEFKESLISKYLYKKGSSNGPDYTPTSKLTTPEKTLKNKIIKCIVDAINLYNDHEDICILNGINESAKDNYNTIIKDIQDNIEKNKSYILTIVYDGKYVGDFELFKEKLSKQAIERYYLVDKKESIGNNKRCSICKELKDEVYGNANIFTFFTVDKIGYVSGGFNKLKSWRNFPVCKECAIVLELGKRYLDENLSFTFQGRKFYLIPKLLHVRNLDKILRTLSNIQNENVDDKYVNIEETIISRLARLEDYAVFDMLFYEKIQNALNIELEIQEILPSRFKMVFDCLTHVKRLLQSCERSKNINLNFSFINTLFPRKNYNRYFLETVDIIISNKEIDYKFIMQHLRNHIIRKFNEEEGKFFYSETIKSYCFLIYLRFLGVLFKERGTVNLMSKFVWDIKNYQSKEELFENFFEDNMDFFNTADKKAVFLIGLLSQKLLNLQYAKEKRKPFVNRLKGLKLNQKDMKRLLPEIQNKFIEYEGDYYREIQALASIYLLEAGDKWTISELDIPFYLSLGMNLERHIILRNDKGEE